MKQSDYIKTLIPVALVLFFLSNPIYGSAVIVLTVWFIGYLLYNIARMISKSDERKKRGIRLAIWFTTLVLTWAIQIHWESSARSDADQIAHSVLDYKTRSGVYPNALADIGLDEAKAEADWSVTYKLRDGKPTLYYSAILMPLSTYSFDFDQRRWQLESY